MTASPTVIVEGLNDLEKNELLDLLPEGSVHFSSVGLDEDHYHGDVATLVATVVGSIATYKAIALWITMRRSKARLRITNRYQSGGEIRENVLEYEGSEQDSDDKVIKELSSLFKVPPSDLIKPTEAQ
jgi:hypothetical protein